MPTLPSFEAFFAAVYGYAPFPWQRDLAAEVLASGWPDLLDLPTGAGKTSALDIALYCLAAAPERMPRRAVLVVDRRIVVDQGADHARHLLKVLTGAQDGPAKAVADALKATFWKGDEDTAPFAVAVMRGGMPRDNDWAKRPDQPVLGVSTVDQLGSRLLFRGYGVSPKSASIHAGLIGNDTLILLDEVHLAAPFAQTLSAIHSKYRAPNRSLPDRFAVVRMSATAGSIDPNWKVFRLSQEDKKNERLSLRLSSSKRGQLELLKVKGTEAERRGQIAKAAVEHARRLQATANVVAIVVNRVDTARQAYQLLRDHHAQATEAYLITGRMRPIDRDQFVNEVLFDRLGPRQSRSSNERPLVLVATQCIEAGADLDFDALVTECASLDALKQRFGRLDRQGLRRVSNAVLLGRSDATAGDATHPIYGQALGACWQWLTSVAHEGIVDFGISALPNAVDAAGNTLTDVLAPTSSAPVLLPAHVDAWCQTSPPGLTTDPDIALWLHGPDRESAEVQVIWRSEIVLPVDDEQKKQLCELTIEALNARRPSSLEAISLPLFAARSWLAKEAIAPIADVATRDDLAEGDTARSRSAISDEVVAFRWRGQDGEFIRGDELRPGDVLLVPTSRGGITAKNFDPDDDQAVIDVGDLAQLRGRGLASVLLNEDSLRVWCLPDAGSAPQPEEDESATETRKRVAAWFDQWPERPPEGTAATQREWTALRQTLTRVRGMQVLPLQLPSAFNARTTQPPSLKLFVSAKPKAAALPPPEIADALTEDDDSSFRNSEVTLLRHSRDVREFAGGFARALGLPEAVVEDLQLAAWLHDVGKADPRFQRWLFGGREAREPLLAKSGLPAGNAASRELARKRANYPAGYRHELLSLDMLERSEAVLAEAHDRELVLHLVASHHGWCRPFAPFRDHPDDLEIQLQHGETPLSGRTRHYKSRLDAGVADRFWSLTREYGWWPLAWLESILRLADHRASEMESEAGP